MLVPKKQRIEVYSHLFKEGVLICKKDILPNSMHPHIKYPVPNLHVIQLMRGFKTKGYVKEQFNWMHYYWFLTNEGIEYLREYLHLPSTIVPTTLKKTAKTIRPLRPGGARRELGRSVREKREYRTDEKEVAPADFKPGFAGEGARGARGARSRGRGRGFGRGFRREETEQ